MMAEDDSRYCFGVNRPLIQPSIMKIRQYACFFKARLMVMPKYVEILAKSLKLLKNWICKRSDFQRSMKNGFEPSNIYSFSCRIRIRIQNWTKATPKPDFTNFWKIMIFIKFSIPRVLSIFHKICMGAHNHPPKLGYGGCTSKIQY